MPPHGTDNDLCAGLCDKEVQRINAEQIERFVKKIHETLWIVQDKTIAVLGLAFKPNTDDMRSAPSLEVIRSLQKEGARIRAYDPKAMEKAREVLSGIEFCDSPYAAAKDADALLICTEWDEFRHLDLGKLRSVMGQPIVLDGRNIYDPKQMEKLGFVYKSIGR